MAQAQSETEEGTIELDVLEQYFIDSEDGSREAREKSELARDFYDNDQLTTAQIQALHDRKQPDIVFNLIAPKIDFLLGTERQTRTDPKAFPRTPKHDDAAAAVTDAIRYVLDKEDFDIKASQVFENKLIEGYGGCSVEVVKKPNSIDVVLHFIRWDRYFFDPYSMAKDFSDSRYDGIVIWMDIADAKARWKDAADQIQARMDELSDSSETFDDKPVRFFNKRRLRVQVFDMYFKWRQKWHHAIFIKGVWLVKPELSKYIDEDGMPENPHIMIAAKVKRDGNRYGPTEALLPMQKEINSRRSKMLHISHSKQTFSKEGLITDKDAFKKELQKPDGHVEFPNSGEFGKDFGVLPSKEDLAPQLLMYQDAKATLDSVQANAALAGKTEGDLSGRAIQTLQQGGMVELTPLFDGLAQWKKSMYRAVWNRIRQFWREEKWIRVTDDEENLKFVGLNQPITLAEQRIAEGTGLSVKDVREQFSEEIAEIHRIQPEMQETAEIENEVAEIDVDIILEEVPDVINLQSEQFDLLVKMYQANPDGIDWEDIIAVSQLRNKKKVLNKELDPEERQALEAQQAAQAEADAIVKAGATADISATQAKAAKDSADAESTQIENAAQRQGIAELLKFVNERRVL